MSETLLDRHTPPAPRPVRRRWGVVVVTVIAVVTLWAVGKHVASGGLAASEVEVGVVSMHAAVATRDTADFDRAHEHFVDAASVSPVDRYPVFLIRTNERLREPGGEGPHEEIAAALAKRDYGLARQKAASLGEPGSAPRVYWERLIESFDSLDEGGV